MNWQTAGPVLLSLMVWKKPLTLAGLEKLEAAGKESAGIGEKSGSYSYRKAITQWFSSKPTLPPTTKDEKPGDIESQSPTKMSRVGGTNALQSPSSGSPPNLTLGGVPTSNAVTAAATGGVSASNIPHASSQSNMSDNVSDIISEDGRPMRKYSFFAKSLRLNSEQLVKDRLKGIWG